MTDPLLAVLCSQEEDDDIRDSMKLVKLPSLESMRVCQLACGGLHTGALTLDGRVFTWGCNDDEALGRPGDESLPRVVEGGLLGKRVTMMTAGDSHMATLTSEGQVGQTARSPPSQAPFRLSPPRR